MAGNLLQNEEWNMSSEWQGRTILDLVRKASSTCWHLKALRLGHQPTFHIIFRRLTLYVLRGTFLSGSIEMVRLHIMMLSSTRRWIIPLWQIEIPPKQRYSVIRYSYISNFGICHIGLSMVFFTSMPSLLPVYI